MSEPNKKIVDDFKKNFNEYTETWCTIHSSESYTGGKMRGDRGSSIEDLARKTIDKIADENNVNLTCKKGSSDKKPLTLTCPDGSILTVEHQVDLHVYLDDKFIAVIECKAYLDSCYYDRACSDFNKFKKFGYNIKTLIFALEDSISNEKKMFIDQLTDNACDRIFYILDEKRNSKKPIYDKRYLKTPNDDKIVDFIDHICDLITLRFD